MKNSIFIILVGFSITLFGQNKRYFDSLVNYKISLGLKCIDSSKYENATVHFLQATQIPTTLPNEILFYLGKCSYYLKEYEKSIQLIDKFATLTDTNTSYYIESQIIKEEILKKEEKNITVQIQNTEKPCKDEEVLICPICRGTKVIVKNSKIGPIFTNCESCDEKGQIKCIDYLDYLRGKNNK